MRTASRRLTCAFLFALVVAATLSAAADAPVAKAAEAGDAATVRALLKQGADVNAPQGDGMTALHWAALRGDTALTSMLLAAGANLRATTRLGAITPPDASNYAPLWRSLASSACAVTCCAPSARWRKRRPPWR